MVSGDLNARHASSSHVSQAVMPIFNPDAPRLDREIDAPHRTIGLLGPPRVPPHQVAMALVEDRSEPVIDISGEEAGNSAFPLHRAAARPKMASPHPSRGAMIQTQSFYWWDSSSQSI